MSHTVTGRETVLTVSKNKKWCNPFSLSYTILYLKNFLIWRYQRKALFHIFSEVKFGFCRAYVGERTCIVTEGMYFVRVL